MWVFGDKKTYETVKLLDKVFNLICPCGAEEVVSRLYEPQKFTNEFEAHVRTKNDRLKAGFVFRCCSCGQLLHCSTKGKIKPVDVERVQWHKVYTVHPVGPSVKRNINYLIRLKPLPLGGEVGK